MPSDFIAQDAISQITSLHLKSTLGDHTFENQTFFNFIDRQNYIRQYNLFPITGLSTGCNPNVTVDFNLVPGTTKPKAEEWKPYQTRITKSQMHHTVYITVWLSKRNHQGRRLSNFIYQCQHCCSSHHEKPRSFVSYNYQVVLQRNC